MVPPPRRAAFPALAALLLAALGVSVALPPPASAAPGDRKFLNLRGRVADERGLPVEDARVECLGTREAIALTGRDGRFNLTIELGTLESLVRTPARVTLRARVTGQRVVVTKDEAELAIEVRLRAEGGTPVLEARSNFGIIADAVVEALAIPGDRTASIRVSFVAAPGPEATARARVPEKFQSLPVHEPWLVERFTPAPEVPRPAPPREVPAKEPAPVASPVTPPVPETDSGRATAAPPPSESMVANERSAPESSKKQKKPKKPKRVRTPNPPKEKTPRTESASSVFAPPLPTYPGTNLDSIRQAQEFERQAQIAAAQAVRDSIFSAQQAASLARRAMMDSIRAAREAVEDSLRRERLGLPPRAAAAPEPQTRAETHEPQRDDRARASSSAAKPPSGNERPGIASTVGPSSTPSGLQRIEARADVAADGEEDRRTRARLEADTCGCRVRGTIELEFNRLLTSPLKVEVSMREMPAIRDTIELFMGSPRAFEFRRVPCGRWSLAVRPFSERPFGVTTPAEVAPFDCRQRGLRQVRIVLAPTRSGR